VPTTQTGATRARGWDAPATAKQLAFLDRLLDELVPAGLTVRTASELIETTLQLRRGRM
jgi:hypothetical protein